MWPVAPADGAKFWTLKMAYMKQIAAFEIYLFRPPGPAAAGRVGLYILLLYFIFLPELIDENRRIGRSPILYQQWSPRTHS